MRVVQNLLSLSIALTLACQCRTCQVRYIAMSDYILRFTSGHRFRTTTDLRSITSLHVKICTPNNSSSENQTQTNSRHIGNVAVSSGCSLVLNNDKTVKQPILSIVNGFIELHYAINAHSNKRHLEKCEGITYVTYP